MDRSGFFSRIRPEPFKGAMSQSQVDGITAILDEWDRRKLKDTRWLAYKLATAFWETARTMQPIKEIGGNAYFTKMYDVAGNRPGLARQNGNVNPGDGPRYCGRGYVQLTWRNNYRRMGDLLGHDLEGNPDLALKPDIAAAIMFEGMTRGSFTGKKLSDYFNDTKDDPVNARRIINGTDKANEIVAIHTQFLSALTKARTEYVAPPPDIHPVEQRPASPLAGLIASLSSIFKRKA